MGRTVCTEPQCLYKGDLYIYLIVDIRCGVQDLLCAGSDSDVTVSKSIEQPSYAVLRNDVDWPRYYSYICLLPENRLRIGFGKAVQTYNYLFIFFFTETVKNAREKF